ncbi:hypothetical protein ACWDCL_05945 [Streptomyces sp. NPDC001009]
MNYRAYLARVARNIKAVFLWKRAPGGGAWRPWHKIRHRLRFLRWALAVQILKGAAYAGGTVVIQLIAARYLLH